MITENLTKIKNEIISAEQHFGRPLNSVQLLAVSKTQPASAVIEAFNAGQKAFAENYLQEALSKMQQLQHLALEWHFIGAIQSNKTQAIAQHFSWVHSVTRYKIAQRLHEQRPENLPALNVCIEVNLSEEPQKSGVQLQEVAALAEQMTSLSNLKLRGLMAIPAPTQDVYEQRATFKKLKQLYDTLNKEHFALDTLSMGMSHDFNAAIAEGATIIRLGTAIFGPRKA